jgi:hypothetical protein
MDQHAGQTALGYRRRLLLQARVQAMQNISIIPSFAPFEPEQTHTMGVAFDAAWSVLAAKGGIAACDVEEKREQLGRWIITLTRNGENNASMLAHDAIERMDT